MYCACYRLHQNVHFQQKKEKGNRMRELRSKLTQVFIVFCLVAPPISALETLIALGQQESGLSVAERGYIGVDLPNGKTLLIGEVRLRPCLDSARCPRYELGMHPILLDETGIAIQTDYVEPAGIESFSLSPSTDNSIYAVHTFRFSSDKAKAKSFILWEWEEQSARGGGYSKIRKFIHAPSSGFVHKSFPELDIISSVVTERPDGGITIILSNRISKKKCDIEIVSLDRNGTLLSYNTVSKAKKKRRKGKLSGDKSWKKHSGIMFSEAVAFSNDLIVVGGSVVDRDHGKYAYIMALSSDGEIVWDKYMRMSNMSGRVDVEAITKLGDD